jgi:hypothetical protein
MPIGGDKTNKPAQSRGGAAIRRRWWAGRFKRRRRQAGYSLEQMLMSGLVRDPKTGCLLWRQGKRRVYGAISISAPRLAWEIANGPIPEGMQVLHRCDEPRCCEPDHLFLGTAADNMADMRRKGRGRNQHTVTPKAPRPQVLANTRRRKEDKSAVDPSAAQCRGPEEATGLARPSCSGRNRGHRRIG